VLTVITELILLKVLTMLIISTDSTYNKYEQCL
jgi:hypothetical protein